MKKQTKIGLKIFAISFSLVFALLYMAISVYNLDASIFRFSESQRFIISFIGVLVNGIISIVLAITISEEECKLEKN